ncbi:unnamed protein product [Adineta ricciae]|uniref:Uncharacterized protein n=1 Tax=Adineta ricciae TaxID=249248 RepID=A0A816DPT9_ADIRI|nr:unnamed protein product [Adineta ricciae]CAF1635733.1 unnamed protein product [Adineta ricciae]
MLFSKVNHVLINSILYSRMQLIIARFGYRNATSELRQYFEKEINEHKKKGTLPTTFILHDSKYYETLSRIRSKSDRLSYLRSLMAIINTPPTVAVPQDSGGVHTGFLTPYKNLAQSDLVNMSVWNYLKAQRLHDNLFLDCSNISSLPLARLIIDMRAIFNALIDPWWPILLGVSDERHSEIIDILKNKHRLHGPHLSTWETSDQAINEKDFVLICANHGETIYGLDSNENYVVQIDGDHRQCCLGNVKGEKVNLYKSVVKLESRTKSFNNSKRILTPDLFQILASLKMKGLFYRKVLRKNDDESHNIKPKARSGLISH